MPTGKWMVFDTSVYIAAIRGGLSSPAFLTLHENIPRTYLPSVVSAELRAGATSETARRAVHHFTRRAQKVRRIVVPTLGSWEKAGDILGQIRSKEPDLRSKILGVWNDLLIALCARQLGALLVIHNARDFEILRRYLAFDFRALVN